MKILTIGGLLAEIMRVNVDEPFTDPYTFIGPYPSGDPAIFINEAAKLGNKCIMIGTVGNDDFGKCITNRLLSSGVDTSSIKIINTNTTGTAFVAYFGDGSRKFIYHWSHSAAGDITVEDIEAIDLEGVDWVHITGITLAINDNCKNAIYRLVELLPESVNLSFDPNIRPEILSVEEIRKLCEPVINRANYLFPSLTEAKMLTGEESDYNGCISWANQGKIVVLKKGEDGCDIFGDSEIISVSTFKVEEVDPTGAGDSFCAGFVHAIREGKSLKEAGYFGNAVGAISVTRKGPMEGASTLEEVKDFIEKNRKILDQ